MPKLGMEPIRRAALIDAAIAEIGAVGTLDVTVGQIARRAGVSSGLAHHYFGSKEQIFLAAMRHTLKQYGAEVRVGLAAAPSPRMRLESIVSASFSAQNFTPECIAAWLNFYVLAQTSGEARRLLRLYQRRLASNLTHGLRPLIDSRAPGAAARLAGLIDGLYLHFALNPDGAAGPLATAQVLAALDLELGGAA
jgi:TetR/AcrR family transcriptional repressor of bet genes